MFQPYSPLVTAIIPTYNRVSFLGRAVDSVLGQSYPKIELIVVDDGSRDETKKFLTEKYGNSLKYIFQKNGGASSARNRGILESTGDLLAFLDSDDRWEKNKLEKQVPVMEDPAMKISHTQETWYRRGKVLSQKKKHQKRAGDLFLSSLELCSISMSTVLVKRDLFEIIGFFDETFAACEDYDMWLRVTAKFPVGLVDEPLTVKDGGRPDQLSNKIPRLDRFRIKAMAKLLEGGGLSEVQHKQTLAMFHKKSHIYIKGCIKHGREEEAGQHTLLVNKFETGS
ncbi:MAG: glycosyltransferase family 2 protein [Nitrospinota bacterium]